MVSCFVPRQWRLPRVVWFLMIFELPFTVANLALFGIASPNLYRTILWRIGGEHGFNSEPSYVLYSYANYRPVKTPLVWSNFNTQYHLIIGVLCTFFWLIKATMWILKVFIPIFSFVLHAALMSLWAYGLYIQTSGDTIDPAHQSKGAPWYITKSCNIVDDSQEKQYCMQAKASFAVTIIMVAIYASFLLLSAYSLIPTSAAKQAHAAKRAEKRAFKEKYATSPIDNDDMTAEQQWQHMWELQQLPRTPGFKSPMTPRTRTFHDLEGGGGGGAMYSQVQVQPTYEQGQAQQQWYGGANGNGNGYEGGGGVTVQQVSPIDERDEFIGGKGKGSAGTAY